VTDATFQIETADIADGTAISVTLGAPVNKTYTGTVTGDAATIVAPSADVEPGTVQATVSADGVASIVVQLQSQSIPVINSPANGATLTGNTFTINITPLPNHRHDLYVDSGSGFIDQAPSITHPDTSITSLSLPTDGRAIEARVYYWVDGTNVNQGANGLPINTDTGEAIDFVSVSYVTSTSTALFEAQIPQQADSSISDAEFSAMMPGTTRHYVSGEDTLSVVQSNGEWWIQADHVPASNGSNQVSAFHNLAGIDVSKPIHFEQIVEFDDNWTAGDIFIVQKCGHGIQARATDGSYVVGNSQNKTGFSSRFEVYGPNGPQSANTPSTATIGGYIYFVGWENGNFLARHVETDMVVVPGSTYRMVGTVTPHAAGNADGRFDIEVERLNAAGNVVETHSGSRTGIEWMQGAFRFDGTSFDSFFGGNNSDYSPQGLATIRYRGHKVYQ